MSVFKKLKDVLFDIEEEEIPVITRDDKKPKEEENPIKEIKMPKDDIEMIEKVERPVEVTNKETIKSEPKFNFPLDIEEEIPVRSKKREYFDEEDDYISSRASLRETRDRFEEPKRKNDSYDYDYSRLNIVDPRKKNESKPFKISPIISPVYGILDQNYTKDDVIVKNETNPSKGKNKPITIDDVRKKAYGKKEEVVDNQDEFEEPLRTLDEILIDKEEEKKEIIAEEKIELEDDPILDRNEPIGVYDDELPDEPYADEVQEKTLDKEDSIESDLFNLIDSMYEERNEREEE